MNRHGRRSSERWSAVGGATAPGTHVPAAGRLVPFFHGISLFAFVVGAVAVADHDVGAAYTPPSPHFLILSCDFVVLGRFPIRRSRFLPNETGQAGEGFRLTWDCEFKLQVPAEAKSV